MIDKPDKIFSERREPLPFRFDQQVAEVFPDMIKRSVPGYPIIIQQIEQLAKRYATEGSNCYDLGCSLGAASLSISNGILHENVKIIGVDNSIDMLQRCQQHINAFKHKSPIELVHDDIQNIHIQNASMVVINFTLQFIPEADRQALLNKIFTGMNDGGLLLLSEKILFSDDKTNQLMIDLHHQFKRDNGYSDLEISQKRNALETVLVPDTIECHQNRLLDAGFESSAVWLQQFNFASFVAIK